MRKYVIGFNLAMSTLVISACTLGNSQWVGGIGGGYADFQVTQKNSNEYILEAKGAQAVKREQLVEGYQARAKQLCEGKHYQTKYNFEPYQYTDRGGAILFTYTGLKMTGTVSCQK